MRRLLPLAIVLGLMLTFILYSLVRAEVPPFHPAPNLGYTIRLPLASDGVMIQDTPVPTATPTRAPTATPTATPTPIAHVGFNCGYGEPIAWFDNWRDSVRCFGVSIAKCESGFNPYAVSPSGLHHGLFQLQRSWFDDYGFDWERRYDPYYNSMVAEHAAMTFGFWPWKECT